MCCGARFRFRLSALAYEVPLALEEVDTRTLTDFDAICNFNFDDLCPMHDPETGIDFGGRIRGGLLTEIRGFLDEFPETAMTFFVVPDYEFQRSQPLSTAGRRSCNIALAENAHWLDQCKALAERFRVELAVHGFHHRQNENPFFCRHTEFAFKTASESRMALASALACFRRANLSPVGFRQPGWDLASDLHILPILRDLGFTYLCGSSIDGGLNVGRERVSHTHPTLVGPIVNLPQNIGLDEDLPSIFQAITRTVEARGIISIKGHFVTRGMPNALGPNLPKLRRIASFIRQSFAGQIEHLTMASVASRVIGKMCQKAML